LQLTVNYPFVAKTIRDARKPPEDRRHCCGMTLQNEGIGYKDLDELFTKPTDLEFIIELLSVEQPDDYQKDSWQLNDEEKINMVKVSKDRGNEKYNAKDYKAAQESYAHAIGLLEQLMLKYLLDISSLIFHKFTL
jgi:AH receptor-interacting protein